MLLLPADVFGGQRSEQHAEYGGVLGTMWRGGGVRRCRRGEGWFGEVVREAVNVLLQVREGFVGGILAGGR